jgi:membrane protein YqaA with SNARE-associated domain
MFKKTYQWMENKVDSPYATPFLAVLFYIEAICFLPTDPMLVVYCLKRREHAWYYAAIATGASVLGGITGYYIGAWLWRSLGDQIIHTKYITWFITPEHFTSLRTSMAANKFTTMLFAGIPPIPYKAATLTAGFCNIALGPFIACSIIIRGTRFFLVAGLVKYCGPHVKKLFERYANVIAFACIGIIIALVYWYKS